MSFKSMTGDNDEHALKTGARLATGGMPLLNAPAARRSSLEFSDRQLSAALLSTPLWAA
jgi:hypothetical protein